MNEISFLSKGILQSRPTRDILYLPLLTGLHEKTESRSCKNFYDIKRNNKSVFVNRWKV